MADPELTAEERKDLARRRRQSPRSRTSPSLRPPANVEKCPATSKRTGKRCGLASGWGTEFAATGVPNLLYRIHGGATPSCRKHNARLVWEYELSKSKATLDAGFEVSESPEEMLLDECARSARWPGYSSASRSLTKRTWLTRAGPVMRRHRSSWRCTSANASTIG